VELPLNKKGQSFLEIGQTKVFKIDDGRAKYSAPARL
jgi:hypothetical protein